MNRPSRENKMRKIQIRRQRFRKLTYDVEVDSLKNIAISAFSNHLIDFGFIHKYTKDVHYLPPTVKLDILQVFMNKGMLTEDIMDYLLNFRVKEIIFDERVILNDFGIKKIAETCPYLQIFELNAGERSKWNLSNDSLINLFNACIQLQTVILRNCDFVDDLTILALTASCANLKYLDLSGCLKITDISMKSLSRSCPNIETLDISTTSVSNNGLKVLIDHKPLLRNLTIKNCSFITSNGIAIFDQCFTLKKLVFVNPEEKNADNVSLIMNRIVDKLNVAQIGWYIPI